MTVTDAEIEIGTAVYDLADALLLEQGVQVVPSVEDGRGDPMLLRVVDELVDLM